MTYAYSDAMKRYSGERVALIGSEQGFISYVRGVISEGIQYEEEVIITNA